MEHRPNLLKVISNTGWLFADKLLRMGVGLFVGVWVARYLGPEQFGLLNYATAFVALFGAVASLGLNGIVVRDLVREPDNANTTLGTAFFLQILGGLLAFTLAVVAIGFARPDDALAKLMVIVLGFMMIFKSTEVVKFWFESQVQSKFTVWVEIGAFLLIATVKVALILNEAPLMTFVWAAFAEGAVVALGLMAMYAWRGGRLRNWQVQYTRVRTLLTDSWPLILSSSFVLINMNIDKVMLGQLANEQEIGLYSAASTLVGVWYFIPLAIGGSVAPKLTTLYSGDVHHYKILSKRIYRHIGFWMLIIAFAIFITSDLIILLLYGSEYASSGSILAISIWSIIFVSKVSIRGRLLVIEGAQIYVFLLVLLGLITNVLLNMYLIPSYGATGAAYAFTLSWGMSAIIYPIFFKKTRFHAF